MNFEGDTIQRITEFLDTTVSLQNYYYFFEPGYFAVLPFLLKNGPVFLLVGRWHICHFTVEVRIATA